MRNNAKECPEAWEFFIEHARNIMDAPEVNHLGNYSVPIPDGSGNFFYSDCPGKLFHIFAKKFYEIRLDSPSVYGKIQYIVQNF